MGKPEVPYRPGKTQRLAEKQELGFVSLDAKVMRDLAECFTAQNRLPTSAHFPSHLCFEARGTEGRRSRGRGYTDHITIGHRVCLLGMGRS